MRSRRVPVLRLGSRGPGGDARSLRLCPPSVRKRLHASASVGECRASSGIANRRETQNCRHFLRLAFQKCQQSQGSGGSWSRNADLSSLLARLGSSRLKSVNSHRDRGGCGRETQICRHFWTRLGSSCLKSVNSHRDPGGCGRETQICRHFWTRLGSSRLKSVNSHRDWGGSWSRNAELSSLWPCLRREREERRKERGEKRDERREERREEREERRERRGEKRDERRE